MKRAGQAGFAALVAAALLAGACSGGRPSAHPASSTSEPPVTETSVGTAAAPPTRVPPTATPLPAPTCDGSFGTRSSDSRLPTIEDVSFVDALHGWALGQGSEFASGKAHLACPWVGLTNDGGRSWTPLAAPNVPLGATPGKVQNITFIDRQHGFLWGGALWATADGGSTWRQLDVDDGEIEAMPVVGTNVWRVFRNGIVDSSDDFGDTWERRGRAASFEFGDADFVRIDGLRAASLGSIGPVTSAKFAPLLTITTDGGRTWQQIQLDRQLFTHAGYALAASASGTLWVLGVGLPAGTSQGKWLYRSDDGGQTWTLVAAHPVLGPITSDTLNNLRVSGEAFWIEVGPDGSLYIGTTRSTLYRSRDSGLTWEQAIPYQLANPSLEAGVHTPLFVDRLHGWVVSGPYGGVLRTDDGGQTWDLVTLPK